MNNVAINEAFNSLIKEYELFKNEINDYKAEIDEKLSTYSSNFENVKEEITTFKAEQKEELNQIISSIKEEKEKLDNYYNNLFTVDNSIENQINQLKSEIEDYYTELISGTDNNEAIKDKISHIYARFSEYKKELFGYSTTDENGETIKYDGLKDEIKDLIKKYNDEIEKLVNDADELLESKTGEFDGLLKTKKEEMDDLLSKMNINYNTVEQEALSKKYFQLSKDKNKPINNSITLLTIYSITLTVALMILFTNGVLKELFSSNLVAGAIIRIAITTPLMYLIIITSNKLKREITIRDQYNYKGSIMSTYRNISTHIKNENINITPERQTELLEKVFDRILENEADKLEKSEQFTLKQLTKFTEKVAKELGTDKKTLISILPDLIEKINLPEKKEKENIENNE